MARVVCHWLRVSLSTPRIVIFAVLMSTGRAGRNMKPVAADRAPPLAVPAPPLALAYDAGPPIAFRTFVVMAGLEDQVARNVQELTLQEPLPRLRA
jgi:hypothetical protein